MQNQVIIATNSARVDTVKRNRRIWLMKEKNEIGIIVFNNKEVPYYTEMDGHYAPVPMFLGDNLLKNLPFSIAAVDISKKLGQPIAELHKHNQAEVYFIPSPGVKLDVKTDKGCVTVESPTVVVIPKHTDHQFIIHSCMYSPCYIMGIFTDLSE